MMMSILFKPVSLTEEVPEGEEKAEGEAGEGEEKVDDEEEEEEQGPLCNQSLLNSYNLMGQENPEELKMDICTSVTSSCCQLKDQLVIFDGFKTGGEIEALSERLGYHSRVNLFFFPNFYKTNQIFYKSKDIVILFYFILNKMLFYMILYYNLYLYQIK